MWSQVKTITCTFTNDDIPPVDADLSVVKTITTLPPYIVGSVITFTIEVTNNGPATATAVEVNDLPANLGSVQITASANPDEDAGDCGTAGNTTFPCTLADMANGEVVTLTVTGVVQ